MKHRQGSVYVAVLMASLLVASLAMAALSSSHYFAKQVNSGSDYRLAQLSADAALDWSIAHLGTDPNWRTSHIHNADVSPRNLNGVSIRYRLFDEDGNLADDPLDPCDLIVTANTTDGSAFSWRATLEPAGPGLNCLEYAIASQKEIIVQGLGTWSTDHAVASQETITANSLGYLTADCYASNGCSGDIYGSINTLSDSLEIPNVSALNYYIDQGTSIDSALLPQSSGKLQFDGQLLSENTNTLSGVVDPLGIYVIDCGGLDLEIKNSRLHCTLVVANAGNGSKVMGSVFWEAAQPNYPALLVENDFGLELSREPLEESAAGVNFNPAGTPYRGVVDSSTNTVYPSQIHGLIYINKLTHIGNPAAKTDVFGVIVSGDKVEGAGHLFVHYRDLFSLSPPPGFGSFSSVRIVPGSVRRVATP